MTTKSKKMRLVSLALIIAIAATLFIIPVTNNASAASSFTTVTYKMNQQYLRYVPSTYQKGTNVPLIVALHGCTQTAQQFATSTKLNKMAEKYNFIVIYPMQATTRQIYMCWNFYWATSRTATEPQMVANMVSQVKSQYSIDSSKVYVVGFSAGGALAASLALLYPDVFAAASITSGLMHNSSNMYTSTTAMLSGSANSPVNTGRSAYSSAGSRAHVIPIIVFHGLTDSTVNVVNSYQIMCQFAAFNDLADDGEYNRSIRGESDVQETTSNYIHYKHYDSNGKIVMERYVVSELAGIYAHVWNGGDGVSYNNAASAIDETQLIMDFFFKTIQKDAPAESTTTTTTTTTTKTSTSKATTKTTTKAATTTKTTTTTTTTTTKPVTTTTKKTTTTTTKKTTKKRTWGWW